MLVNYSSDESEEEHSENEQQDKEESKKEICQPEEDSGKCQPEEKVKDKNEIKPKLLKPEVKKESKNLAKRPPTLYSDVSILKKSTFKDQESEKNSLKQREIRTMESSKETKAHFVPSQVKYKQPNKPIEI